MKDHIAESVTLTKQDKSEKSYKYISQIFILGNFLTISAIPLLPERGNVLVTERFRLDELDSLSIKFN